MTDRSLEHASSLRYSPASPLDEDLTPRKKNRANERLMAFFNRDGFFVSATALVDEKGKQLNFNELLERLDLIHFELEKLNATLDGVLK